MFACANTPRTPESCDLNSSNMELFLGCICMLLPGVVDGEFTSDRSLLIAAVCQCSNGPLYTSMVKHTLVMCGISS